MTALGDWVEHWLDRYCAPGEHDLYESRAGVLACIRCRKEELAGGTTCMVCGIPGERFSALVGGSRPGSLTGKLCGPCMDDFGDRRSIRGWSVAAAAAA
jgi:hypothetical protein